MAEWEKRRWGSKRRYRKLRLKRIDVLVRDVMEILEGKDDSWRMERNYSPAPEATVKRALRMLKKFKAEWG